MTQKWPELLTVPDIFSLAPSMLACIFLQAELTAKARDSESPVQERFETTVLFVRASF